MASSELAAVSNFKSTSVATDVDSKWTSVAHGSELLDQRGTGNSTGSTMEPLVEGDWFMIDAPNSTGGSATEQGEANVVAAGPGLYILVDASGKEAS